ncbi:DUF3221 domain-containing protein [Paenisporosarcina sp. TG20]|uniref:DUF3221 domain-containing protein n=1 Tax=Paenisporosarcina sp. TG20 TaxID=1211706 RepID=UPI00031EE246|nr:DUF3221 domain-containing protein [Paenisporosarcina sp. TG20]
MMIKMSILVTLLVALVGCGTDDGGDPSTVNGDPSSSDNSQFVEYGVAGNIVEITTSNDEAIAGTIMVEGPEDNGAKYKEAVVTVKTDTKIYINDLTDYESLEVGMYVNVFFEGPVKESLPVQATAKQINIIPEDPVQETTQEGTILPGLPVAWIIHRGEKYTLENVYSKEELDLDTITSTNTVTGEGDGTMNGEEIFIEEPSGDLFIIDDSGPNEEWARYIKIDQK